MPTPTAAAYGSNRSPSAGAARRPSLNTLVGFLPAACSSWPSGGLLPTPRASDGVKGSPGQRGRRGDLTLPSTSVRIPVLPTPRASDGSGPGRHGTGGPDLRSTISAAATAEYERRWGIYAEAIVRWETLIGRPAPAPTQPGRHGKPVLSPAFVEFLMGLPEGWVTDLGLPRTRALHVLGNGVVPAQAAAALRLLLCPVRWQELA